MQVENVPEKLMKSTRNPITIYLLAITILSISLRIAVAVYLGNEVDSPPQLTDQRSYHELGVQLLAGHGFSFDRAWYPFTPADTPTAHWSFLYSLFVSGVYAVFGAHPLAVRLVQAILGGLLLPWMVYRLAKATLGVIESKGIIESVALVAALMAGIYGYYVLYSATLMTELSYIIVVLWSLERSLNVADHMRARASPRALWMPGLWLGLSLGIGILLRQSLLPWVPVLFLYLLWLGWRTGQMRSVLVALASVGLVVVLCILPWTIRNYLVYDDFLLLNSNAGFAMYSAQHPMHGTSFSEFDAAPLPDGWWGWSEPRLDRLLMAKGIRFVLDDPVRYLMLLSSRARAFFEFWPSPDTTLLHNAGRTGSFGLFLPLMLYGLFLTIRQPQLLARYSLLLLFSALYTLLHLLTWAMVRYRLPVDAVLMPLSALAAFTLVQHVRTAIFQKVT